jgi:hypothetical protein
MNRMQVGPDDVRPNTLRDQMAPNTFRAMTAPTTSTRRRARAKGAASAALSRRVGRPGLSVWVYVALAVVAFFIVVSLLQGGP